LVRSQIAFALARGYGFATANETALKLMECALLPCKSYSIADFEHGPKALAVHGSAAIVFGECLPHLSEQGCLTIEAPRPRREPEVPSELLPIWDAMFAQWLALHAARARALDPDQPMHLEKVTRTL
jgi:glucosamine--fructose-6-phosphate aminotransferase (isomerizing)